MCTEWKDTYTVGIDEIDDQHYTLFKLLDRSYQLEVQDNNKDELVKSLYELIGYAHYHFSAEERLMIKFNYPHIDNHILEHFSFTNTVMSYEKHMVENNDNLSDHVFDFVKNWLFDHILNSDTEMCKFILLNR